VKKNVAPRSTVASAHTRPPWRVAIPAGLTEALGALEVKLTPAHLTALAKAFPPDVAAGGRYPEEHLKHMDSEKRRA